MSQAFYRKYRSRGFDEVVGQRHVTDLLQTAVKNGTISHAYLFTGPRGTGKTSVARILAHAINELPYTDDSTHLDIIEIDAASNRRIDDIRDLREKVHIAPSSARYKVYIIDEVHMLTGESFNALLKTLEEPPSHAVFILATTELHKVPATIVSRTQRFHFRPGSPADVVRHLRMIADKESIPIDDAALRLIAEHSEGGFRDSVSLLDQVSSLGETEITERTIEQLLGLAPTQAILDVVNAIAARDSHEAVVRLSTLLRDGMSPPVIVAQLTKHLAERAASQAELYDILYDIIDIPKSYAPELKLLALVGRHGPADSGEAPAAGHINDRRSAHTSAATARHDKENTSPPAAQTHASKPPSAKDSVVTSAPQPAAGPINWEAILAETLKRAPALHSIVKRANATITDDAITLAFGFKLHRSKMNDEKQRRELASIVSSMYGSSPQIVVKSATDNLNDTASAVADIMGGGTAVIVPTEGA